MYGYGVGRLSADRTGCCIRYDGFIARIGGKNIGLTFVGLALLALQTVYFIIAGAMGASPPPNMSTPGATPYVLGLHGLGGTLLLLLTIWVFFRVKAMGPRVRSSATQAESADAPATVSASGSSPSL